MWKPPILILKIRLKTLKAFIEKVRNCGTLVLINDIVMNHTSLEKLSFRASLQKQPMWPRFVIRLSRAMRSKFFVSLDNIGWSETTTTDAPVQDEAVQAVLGMNQKHILLPCPGIFKPPSLPQKFPLLPTSPPPTYLHPLTSLTSFPTHSISKA